VGIVMVYSSSGFYAAQQRRIVTQKKWGPEFLAGDKLPGIEALAEA